MHPFRKVRAMGLFNALSRRKAQREYDAAMESYNTTLSQWNRAEKQIDEFIEVVQDCINGKTDEQFEDRDPRGFMLNEGEFPVAFLSGAGLLQVVRGPSRYEGGYGGVSFPIFGRVRGHVGAQRGQVIRGAESQTTTDTGEVLITNERVMFRGDVRTEEWKFSRMMSMEHTADGITVFSMSAKGKPSAIGYGVGPAAEVQFRLEIGAAFARNTLPQLLAQLQAEKTHHAMYEPHEPGKPSELS